MIRALSLQGLLYVAIGFGATLASASAQTYAVNRYDDDVNALADPAERKNLYDEFKFIPLGGSPNTYLSLGGDERERFEASTDAALGARYRLSNAYEMHRLLLFAKLRIEGFQAFVQIGNQTETGRLPGPLPTDIDRANLQQAFLQYSVPTGPGELSLRGGRAEMSFDDGALVSLRDGPNVRQVWDGVRVFYVVPDTRVDAFFVRPVAVEPNIFNNSDLSGQTLWGVHFDASPAVLAPFAFNGFYYGNTMPSVRFYRSSGSEETHTFGLRVRARAAGFDGSVGAIGQIGDLGGRPVRAWAAHVDAGWTFALPWSPRVGASGDVLSGGSDAGSVVHTFNALYPNYAFSTEAAVEAPSNLIQPAVTLRLEHSPANLTHIRCERDSWRIPGV